MAFTTERHEAMEQEALFEWAGTMSPRRHELALLFHVPNGGKREAAEAAALKRQGVKAGVPDLCLPVARGKYHGLFIELKYGKNKTSPEQETWLQKLRAQGYAAIVCYGWEAAAEMIIKYLNLEVAE